MHEAKISIVTPSYNQSELLENTIRSVIDPYYEGLEYVIIDGGSNDGSLDIIKKYSKYIHFWISEPDNGHADALNKGFAQTNAEIMGWINSSDIYYPWTLKTVVKIFTDLPEVQWISGIPTIISHEGLPVKIRPDFRNKYDFLSGYYNWLQQESVFWRRRLWDSAGGKLDTELKLACDFELWLRFFKESPLSYVNTILAGFRIHENQRGSVASNIYHMEAKQAFKAFRDSFCYHELFRAFLIRLTNNRRGRLLRELLKSLGCLNWYSHPQITYNTDKQRWEQFL